jgi:hypothetical protein
MEIITAYADTHVANKNVSDIYNRLNEIRLKFRNTIKDHIISKEY